MKEYLPRRIPGAEVLITVKTYPQPYTAQGEIVCTAGMMRDGKWIRIHPVPFRADGFLQFRKYSWLKLDLIKKKSDKRPESYSPVGDHEVLELVDTRNGWKQRRDLVLGNEYTSFAQLLADAHGDKGTSLAVVKPSEILDFTWTPTDRDWPEKWKGQWAQGDFFFKLDESRIVRKVPYDFHYRFLTEGDEKPRRLMVTDWEVGALYWKCLERSGADEKEALRKVRERFYDDLALSRDLHFFVGSNYVQHVRNRPNPFMIVGVFYPPFAEEPQLTLNLPLN